MRVRTIVKLQKGLREGQFSGDIITKTLGAVGLFREQVPQSCHGDFWWVDVVGASADSYWGNRKHSLFWLQRVERLGGYETVQTLRQGTFSSNVEDNICIVRPRDPGPWIAPLPYKDLVLSTQGVRAVLVLHDRLPS